MSAMAKNMADSDLTPEELSRKTNAIFQAFVDTLIDFPKPICAMVNGPAIGIGVTQEQIRNYFFIFFQIIRKYSSILFLKVTSL